MTYPQSDSNAPVLDSEDFYRLKTMLQSPGDIYESEQGAHGFALGPDSDIANIDVFYFDQNIATSLMNSMQISPDRSFVGSVYARMTELYPGPQAPARILFASADLYDPAWRPTGFVVAPGPTQDAIEFVVPVFDVIQYFSDQPSLVPQRSDKTYEFERVQARGTTGSGTGWIVVPAWGRKYGSFHFKNGYDPANLTIEMFGVKLGISTAPSGINSTVQQPLIAAQILAPGDEYNFVYKASTDGSFDYFAIHYSADAILGSQFGGTTHITVSDDAL